MQKHAMALGYFFLAVFCIFTGSQVFGFRIPLLLAALAAALTGVGFLLSACAVQFQAAKNWLVQMWRLIPLARQLPTHPSTFREDHPA